MSDAIAIGAGDSQSTQASVLKKIQNNTVNTRDIGDNVSIGDTQTPSETNKPVMVTASNVELLLKNRRVSTIPEEGETFKTVPEPETGVQLEGSSSLPSIPDTQYLQQSRTRNILKRALAHGVIRSDGNLFPAKKGS